MIPAILGKYLFKGATTPRIISTDTQLEDYVTGLLELDRQTDLNDTEQNIAELLIVLIGDYVSSADSIRASVNLEDLQEALPANDLPQKN